MPSVDVRDRLGIEYPVVQAPLGGGLSRAALAASVSTAGGLGTVGMTVAPEKFRSELRSTREQASGKPYAANLLLPVLKRQHVEVCVKERVSVVSVSFGFDRRIVDALKTAGAFVFHQVGSVEQARRALADGADGLIAQGRGAGGHLLGATPLAELVPQLLDIAGARPVIAAGGIHDAASAAAARATGATGVCAGTRFLLSFESHAHDAYKARLLAAQETLVTLLFGLGWHGLHRVVPNAATARWCARDALGPKWVRAVNRTIERLNRALPAGLERRYVPRQRVDVPFYTPVALLRGMDERLIEVTPLYAGECVARIDRLMPAATIVSELASGWLTK